MSTRGEQRALEPGRQHGTLPCRGGGPVRARLAARSDIRNPEKLAEIFAAQEQQTSFAGHTHTAGVFTVDCEFLHPSQIGNRYQVGEKKVLINVGSVGQPRDGDPRGSYVIFDGETVEFHRVKYDIEEAIRRFRETPLPEELALRLIEGR